MRYVKMIAVGLLLILLLYLSEYLVSFPFPSGPQSSEADRSSLLLWEFALTAPPALLLSFLAALVLKTRAMKDAVCHAAVWTLMYAGVIFLLSIPDTPNFATSVKLFTTPTIYLLLGFYFAGPLLYSRIAGRKKDQPAT